MIRTLLISSDHKSRIDHYPTSPKSGEWGWLLASSCTSDEWTALCDEYPLHPEEIRKLTTSSESGLRFTVSRDHISFIITYPHPPIESSAKPQFSNALVVLHEKWMLVIGENQMPNAESLFHEMELQTYDHKHLTSHALSHLDQFVISAYAALVEPIVAQAEEVTDHLNHRGELFEQIRTLRHQARCVLLPLRAQARISQLLNDAALPFLTGLHNIYFLDAADQMHGLADQLAAVRDNLLESVEGYTSIQSNHMNKVMKTLTIVSTIFLPATLIASIYGMNFRIPEYGWKYGYAYSITLMTAIAVLSLLFMRKKGWF
ncbi:CorA family divalent cation transporter [Ferroacidibacillus organovorans]|uniref:Magnesium transport protein CorA n=1 Tax=Ferroacidibacillus organovorans TaxID=1765683 RepID=A0A853KBN1_9BACL|nr:CorA family divalent cation transporter [Ferroacidibacillus organovorans]KYP81106.1 hypothetical protein AYJ22_08865 [Ferroacidibacillus organovorans]OAG93808.1 hypothetical protein AYW79_08830 [Ferroacidibacillus organovorans]